MYIEAPTPYQQAESDPPAVFLAGGITGCPDWQATAAAQLASAPCVVLNPRRAAFDIADPQAASAQIAWEYRHLRLPRVLTLFWFPACDRSVTVQPIALYELGGALERRCLDRPVLIGADPGYPRRFDLVEQLGHEAPDLDVLDELDSLLVAARTLLDPEYALRTGSW